VIFAKGVDNSGRFYFQAGFNNVPQTVKSHREVEFYIPPLPNLYDNGEVCLGDAFDIPTYVVHGEGLTLDDIPLQTLVGLFWQTEFSEVEDRWEKVSKARRLFGKDPYGEWESLSKNDPKFVLGVDWGELWVGLGSSLKLADMESVE